MADSKKDCNERPHFTCIWTIDNVCSFLDAHSPTFTVKEMDMTLWYLEIIPSFPEHIGVGIIRVSENGPESIEIKFELSFLGQDGLPLVKKVGVKKFEMHDSFTFDKFAADRDVFFGKRLEFLPRDALTIRCRMWRTGTEISKADLCFARTRMRLDCHDFIWVVREFSSLKRGKVRKILLKTNSTSQLALNLSVVEHDGEESVSIEIERSGGDFERCYVEIHLLDFEGKIVHSSIQLAYEDFSLQRFFQKGILMEDKASLLPNDVLSLRCEVEMSTQIEWEVIENYRYPNLMSSGGFKTDEVEILCREQDCTFNSSSFTEAIKNLLEEGTLSDVSLRTDSKSFPAHKCILSARSPVFRAMFSGDMREKTSKCVEIPDLDEDTLRELLSYIYTDEVRDLEWRGATDLYKAADKYELLDLKRRCATFLKADLSVSSVCTVMVVADMHHDRELREAAQRFVMQQGAEFFTSDEWRSFKEEHSKLAWEIMELIVFSIKNER